MCPARSVRVLQESLGGNAKTSLVIAVANAEDHIDESLQSLQFGSRAMRILTQAVVNERMDVKVNSFACPPWQMSIHDVRISIVLANSAPTSMLLVHRWTLLLRS